MFTTQHWICLTVAESPLSKLNVKVLSKTFLLQHGLVPASVLCLVLFFIYHYQVDYKLADNLFRLEGHHWSLRHQWLFEKVFHEGGKMLSWFLGALVSIFLVASFYHNAIKPFRKGLVFLLCIPLASVALVNILKALSGTACPGELLRYGGSRPDHWSLALLGQHGCTPAGHSSSGYAWLAGYFFALVYLPRWRFHSLLPALLLGITFGLAQQLRGEHFLSHDIFTIAICWYSSLFGFLVFFGGDTVRLNLRE